MNTYQRLTQPERYQIKALLTAGNSQSDIAVILNRDKSTISRELQRNTGQRGYRPKQAHEKAPARQKAKQKVSELIQQKWSPEQISGRLATTQAISVSHEWVYQWILQDKQDGGDLYTHLRCQKKRMKRYGSSRAEKRGQIINRTSIEQRPEVVDKRMRIGDWKADTFIGSHQVSKPVLTPWRNENSVLAWSSKL